MYNSTIASRKLQQGPSQAKMLDSARNYRQPGRGREGGRGAPPTRERYQLRSCAKSILNDRNEYDAARKKKASDNDEKIWNLVTTPTARSIKEVKIKQEIIDNANNPYEILRSGDNRESEENIGKNFPVDLTTDDTLEKLQKKSNGHDTVNARSARRSIKQATAVK